MSTLRLSTTSYVVLGLIALRGPSTSYELKRAVAHSVGFFWPFPHAQLYAEPERLTEAGLLSVRRESDGRRRRTYAITEAGRSELGRWLAQPAGEQLQLRNVAEIKLFFGELAEPQDLQALAQEQIEMHRRRLIELDDIADRFGERADLRPRLVPLALGRRIEAAALEFWLDYVTDTTPAGEATPDAAAGPANSQ